MGFASQVGQVGIAATVVYLRAPSALAQRKIVASERVLPVPPQRAGGLSKPHKAGTGWAVSF